MAQDFWTEVKRRVIKWEKQFRKNAANGTMENIESPLRALTPKDAQAGKKQLLPRRRLSARSHSSNTWPSAI